MAVSLSGRHRSGKDGRVRRIDGGEGAEMRLPAEKWSPRIARRFVAARLNEGPIAHEVVSAASLVTSELVSNAVQHTHAPVRVVIEQSPQQVRVEVSERGMTSAMPPVGWTDAGHGLSMVERFSDKWGVVERDGERSVWCTFRVI
jgi:anti-sigma regulatory factor (Ser/Thr protein kinase)